MADLASVATQLRRIADRLDPTPATAPVPAILGLDEAGERLFQALRTWRTDRARRDAVPPYVIATDRHLMAIAKTRPTDAVALKATGFGPSRTERLGAEVLEVVAKP
ncbi:MAG: HRDC domain-containing protein [Candidatus Thermoplasmatota archaeon]